MMTTDVIEFISRAGPMTLVVAFGLLVWRGELLFRREVEQRDRVIAERDQTIKEVNARNTTLDKEARAFMRDAMEEQRKQRDAYRSEIAEIRKTMHELIAAFSSSAPSDKEPAP